MASGNNAPSAAKRRPDGLRPTILEAACRLFIERGVGGTTMQDLADELGVSRPAIYYHFENKEAVLKEIAERVTAKAATITLEASSTKGRRARDALHDIIVQYTLLMTEHALEFRILDREETLLDALLPGHAEQKRQVLDNLARVIRHGVEQREFREVDPYITALGIIGMCNWTNRWFRAHHRKSAAEVAEIFSGFALGALERPARRSEEPNLQDVVRLLREDLHDLESVASRISDAEEKD